MFNFKKTKKTTKENNQVDKTGGKLSVEMHTMKDDLVASQKNAETDVSANDLQKMSSKTGENSPFLNIDSNAKTEPEPAPSIEKVEIISSKANKNASDLTYSEETLSSVDKNIFSAKKKRQSGGNVPGSNLDDGEHQSNGVGKERKKPKTKLDILIERLSALKRKRSKKNKSSHALEKSMDFDKRKGVSAVKRRVVVMFLLVLLMAIVFGGGYYGWKKNYWAEIVELVQLQKISDLVKFGNNFKGDGRDDTKTKNVSEEYKKYTFSDDVNYIIVSEDNFNVAGIKKIIQEKMSKMVIDDSRVVKFILVDQDAVRLTFTEFSNAFGIDFDASITKDIEDNFSLFLFKGSDGEKRISLVLDISSPKIIDSMRRNESNIISAIEPIFFQENVDATNKVFNDSEYRGYKVRYINFSQNPNLSIDYIVTEKNLIIATSKKSGRLILDRLIDESENEDVVKGDIENNNNNDTSENQIIDSTVTTDGDIANNQDDDEVWGDSSQGVIEPENDSSDNDEEETVIIVD